MRINNYELVIRPQGKSIATEYWHNNACFIEGRKSSSYTIELINRSSMRIKAIVSVDGLCVLDGQPAGAQNPGFVVDGFGSVTARGWAVNDQTAAEFVFSDARKSYSNATNRGTANIGVIGAMIFQESQSSVDQWYPNWHENWYNPTWVNQPTPPWEYTSNSAKLFHNAHSSGSGGGTFGGRGCSTTTVSNNAISPVLRQSSFGTGWGDKISQNLNPTSFIPRDPQNPDQILVIYYDSLQGLQRRGIKPITKRGYSNNEPQPFPSSTIGCPEPAPSWTKTKL